MSGEQAGGGKGGKPQKYWWLAMYVLSRVLLYYEQLSQYRWCSFLATKVYSVVSGSAAAEEDAISRLCAGSK